jgi:alkylated DNA repair dioxygenase AlkB
VRIYRQAVVERMFVYAEAMVPGQRSLFASGDARVDAGARWERIDLGDGSWIDVCRGLLLGADTVLDDVVGAVPWRCGRRRMYDRMVDDPRLSFRYTRPERAPHPVLTHVCASLELRYRVSLGALALNYYRDGRDSVAFHRDRELRELDDTIIAILTLGAQRPFRVRPLARPSAWSRDLAPASGDVLVMGGACQRAWEHGVPKVATAGPRVSATWRWAVTPSV